MKILVTGGAGYVGSFTVRELLERGHDITIVDSLENGHSQSVAGVNLHQGNLEDRGWLNDIFTNEPFDAVLHFAGYIEAGVSVREPARFYRNNVSNSLNLIQAMMAHGVDKLVFSSSAAVYGNPERQPIAEDDSKRPTNPYAWGKLFFERILEDCHNAGNIRSISLRYFNAAGAALDASIGEDHPNESHLIPLTLAVAQGKREALNIFGTDYPTPDGTCIRDYIHVIDLAAAHVVALEALVGGSFSPAYNIGTGQGHSVKKVADVCRKVSGEAIPAIETERREGDPAILVADSTKIQHELGWKPKHSDLETIVNSAWAWHKTHPSGFNDKNTP
jgi:UDP-glucose 4-epimerase